MAEVQNWKKHGNGDYSQILGHCIFGHHWNTWTFIFIFMAYLIDPMYVKTVSLKFIPTDHILCEWYTLDLGHPPVGHAFWAIFGVHYVQYLYYVNTYMGMYSVITK